jgi:hypothetical protein
LGGLTRHPGDARRSCLLFIPPVVAGEREAAYEIGFHYGDSNKLVVIHDLRIEVEGRVAQIDHLLLDRLLDIWIFESKHFAEGVGVNEQGEWVTYWNGRPHGIASPVEQNRRHVAVLRGAFDKGLVNVPRRLGAKLKPQLHSLVLVSSRARISRPKGRAAAARVDGLDTVVKVDQLATTIEKQGEQMSALSTIGSLARLVSMEALEDIGQQLVALHKPSQVDWAARFGLGQVRAVPLEVGSLAATAAASPANNRPCASCGSSVSPKVAAYCEANAQRFGGLILCWDCQRRSRRDGRVRR